MPIISAQVTTDAAIHQGEPVIAGSSTPVRAIVELWRQGMPAEEIPVHLEHLGLAEVFEALRYYLTNREEIDAYIDANRIPDELHGRHFDPETGTIG